jgi:hypothetical protein
MSSTAMAAVTAALVALVGWRARPLPGGRTGRVDADRRPPRHWPRRRARSDAVELAAYLEAMSRELRAGAALAAAFRAQTPSRGAGGAAFAVARDLVAAGAPLGEALREVDPAGPGQPDISLALRQLSCASGRPSPPTSAPRAPRRG